MSDINTTTIELCITHRHTGRGFDPQGVERCLYATVDLLINKKANLDQCEWVTVSLEVGGDS